jgi:geranylgeranyl diphosphate synthase type I
MTTSDVRNRIQAAMRAAFPDFEQRVARYYAMQEYHLGWRDADLQNALSDPGKLLRPQLVLLACRAVGGDAAHALPLAAAIQLIHDFTLIHDDIQDQSDTRRGRPTVWTLWGLAHGINVGDGMFAIAHQSLYGLSDANLPASVLLDIFRRFEDMNLRICEGQFLDMSFEGDLTISADDYLGMIRRKTAALLAGAASLGALVGGADSASVDAMFAFGESLGVAFQIQDDVLGIWGDPEVTGKPQAADLYRRKVSLPIVHALNQAQGDTTLVSMQVGFMAEETGGLERVMLDASGNLDDLKDIYQHKEVSDEHVVRLLAILEASGSRQYCDDVASQYHKQAMEALDRVKPGNNPDAVQSLDQLRAIVGKLLGRKT